MSQKNNNTIAQLLTAEPERLEQMVCESPAWRLDCSRTPIPLESWTTALSDAPTGELGSAIKRLFAGEIVNRSESRPALHMALRSGDPSEILPSDQADELVGQRDAMLAVAERLYRGETPVRTLLHVGIGGSDLGPRLVADALDDPAAAVEVHWLSSLDGRRVDRLFDTLDPATTGLVVASKSFTTAETLLQATRIRDWLGDGAPERCWAATARPERAAEFGIRPEHVLAFPDWVGGRFSLWSSVGVSAAARIGPACWGDLLAGAEAADRRVHSDIGNSVATGLALALDALVRDHGHAALGVVSYAPELKLLAEYLQQLVMESLGKRITTDGNAVEGATSPLVFGGAGTGLQHSLFQAVHQGTTRHPLVLLGAARPGHAQADWHREQLAHLLGQASALVHGRSADSPEQALPGNNPVILLLARQIDAAALGELLANWEHAVYLLGVLWRVNPFDQWGVEEGKRLAVQFRESLENGRDAPDPALQPSMNWLRQACRKEPG